MNEIGIIGLGRFGKVLVNILQKGYRIYGYDIGNIDSVPGVTVCGLEKVLKQQVIFIAVPIRSFKSLIQLIAPKLRNDTTLIDVCSVKTFPVQVMKENLNNNIGIIATHPMFGPDSFQTNNKLKMMMNKVNDPNNQFDAWKEFFENQRIKIIEMSPDDHDKMAAQSQGVTHFLGRMLKQFGLSLIHI